MAVEFDFSNAKHRSKTTPSALSVKEQLFVKTYIETGSEVQALKKAGYKYNKFDNKGISDKANSILRKPHIQEELEKRMEQIRVNNIASNGEIMEYFSEVMRGNIKDQFGLDAPLGERTRAAVELAKRTIDIENKRDLLSAEDSVEVTINWNRGSATDTEDEDD